MPRPVWTGTIAFGLVSVPIKLYTAVRDRSVRFHQLDEQTGSRIRYRRVSEQSGEEVPRERIVKAYELGDGQYVTVTDEEFEAVTPRATRTIDIEDFVELAEVDPVYFDTTYYMGPANDAATRPYMLLHEAMRESGQAAIGRFVLRSKQRLVALRPRDGILALETMHFHDEVADPASVAPPERPEVAERELAAAHQLIDSLARPWEPETYRDTYREELLEIVERKARGEEIVTSEPGEEPAEVIDLVSALRQSIEQSRGRQEAPAEGASSDEDGASGTPASEGDSRPAPQEALDSMTREKLYRMAKEAGIRGRSEMSKDELVHALVERRADTRQSA